MPNKKTNEKSNSKDKDDLKRSLDSKRGIFTSKYEERPNANAYLESSLPAFNQSQEEHIHRHIIQPNSLFSHSNVHHHHANIHMGGQNTRQQVVSHRTPPPEVRFNYLNGSRQSSPIKYVPISNAQRISHSYYPGGQNVSSVSYIPQENVQIRKTFIPQHIYNYVGQEKPMNLVESKVNPEQRPQSQAHSDEAYSLLLREYDKLFKKFEGQCQHSKELQIIINQLKTQLHSAHNKPHPHLPQPQKNKNYSLNIQELHDRIYFFYEKLVDSIVRKRKEKCVERLGKVFRSAHQEFSVSIVEESSSVHRWNH